MGPPTSVSPTPRAYSRSNSTDRYGSLPKSGERKVRRRLSPISSRRQTEPVSNSILPDGFRAWRPEAGPRVTEAQSSTVASVRNGMCAGSATRRRPGSAARTSSPMRATSRTSGRPPSAGIVGAHSRVGGAFLDGPSGTGGHVALARSEHRFVGHQTHAPEAGRLISAARRDLTSAVVAVHRSASIDDPALAGGRSIWMSGAGRADVVEARVQPEAAQPPPDEHADAADARLVARGRTAPSGVHPAFTRSAWARYRAAVSGLPIASSRRPARRCVTSQ